MQRVVAGRVLFFNSSWPRGDKSDQRGVWGTFGRQRYVQVGAAILVLLRYPCAFLVRFEPQQEGFHVQTSTLSQIQSATCDSPRVI